MAGGLKGFIEKEAKVQLTGIDEVRRLIQIIKENNGERIEKHHLQQNKFFRSAKNKLPSGTLIRLRQAQNRLSVAIKGPKKQNGRTKARFEIEWELETEIYLSLGQVKLGPFPTMSLFELVLSVLNIKQTDSSEKKRQSWQMDNVKLSIDILPGKAGIWLEIEHPDEGIVLAMAVRLLISRDRLVDKTFGQVWKEYLQTVGWPANTPMTFAAAKKARKRQV